jgi:ribosomal protein S13
MSNVILQGAKVDPLILAKSLDDEQIKLINQEINKLADAGKLHIEDNLEQKIKKAISEKINIDNKQGKDHSMGKKVNGQSTRHNNRNRPSNIYHST